MDPLLISNLNLKIFSIKNNPTSDIIVPVVYQNNIFAMLLLYSMNKKHSIEEDIIEIISDFASQAGIAIENARLFSEANRLATIDSLTGLYNRKNFFENAKKAWMVA